MTFGKIISINVSDTKGRKKKPVDPAEITDRGIDGDVHGGDWHRQISLLAQESIDKMRKKHPGLSPGDFAENITTRGIILQELPVGQRLRLGPKAIVEITQIGKECHSDCEIRVLTGDCVMPREGVFASVVVPGKIKKGDAVEVLQ